MMAIPSINHDITNHVRNNSLIVTTLLLIITCSIPPILQTMKFVR
jgi:hypothetical protein